MKKFVLTVLVAAALLTAGGWLFQSVVAAEVTTTATPVTTSASFGVRYGGMGCRGGYVATQTTPGYEWLYLHLDAAERAQVDLVQTGLLATHDFASMDETERLETLEAIRTELADYIVESGFVTGLNP